MEYDRRQMLESEPANETTAVTLKSIKEILAETGDLGLLQTSSQPAPAPQGQSAVQSAPQTQSSVQAVPQLQRPPVQSPVLQRPPVQAQAHVQPRRVVTPQHDAIAKPPHMSERRAVPQAEAPAPKAARGGLMSRLFGRD